MDWNLFNGRVEKLLRLNSSVVAVKMVRKGEAPPEGLGDPPQDYTMCQFVTAARVHGLSLLATPDNILCGIAQGMLGLDALPNVAPRFAGARVANARAYQNILRDMPKVKQGIYGAVAVAPLEAASFDPDLLLFVTDPARILRLLHGFSYRRGERVNVRTAAEAGTCGEAMAACLAAGEPALGFPCYGTRAYGLVGDDQLIFALPADRAGQVLDGLEKTHARISPYPIRQFLNTPPYPRVNFLRKKLTPGEEEELIQMLRERGAEPEPEEG